MIDLIKPLSKKDDLSKLKIRKINWDLEIYGKPYQVVDIEGRVHTMGGRWGNNSYYAYPLMEKMSFDNLIHFGGDVIQWGIHYEPKSYIKTKWGETSIRKSSDCYITRNGKRFYEVSGRDYEYALSKAQTLLVELIEQCPMSFSDRNWHKEEIGRKIWWKGQPAKIKSFILDQGCIIIETDGIDKFKPQPYDDLEFWDYEDENDIKTTYLDENIKWFRNEI